jgi:hypothetical protein
MTRLSSDSLLALLSALALALATSLTPTRAADPPTVRPVTTADRDRLHLPAFYKKIFDDGAVPVIASDHANDYALAEAHYIITSMLSGNPKLRAALAKTGLRVAVMAPDELTTDIPEHSELTPKQYWDRRARGLGGTRQRPVTSCGEENLLNYPGDPYNGENILVHEFSHSVHQMGMRELDQTFNKRLRAAYKSAIARGLWKNTCAATNHDEYFAEATQSWFECNAAPNFQHNNIRTKKQVEEYDPNLADLLKEAYGDTTWHYTRPDRRETLDHLRGFTRPKEARFNWPASLAPLTPSPKEKGRGEGS